MSLPPMDFGDFGTSVPSAAVVSNGVLSMAGGEDDFSPEQILEASRIPESVAPASVAQAIYNKTAGLGAGTASAFESMPTNDFIKMCVVLGSLGSRRGIVAPFGRAISEEVFMLHSFSMEALMSYLVVAKQAVYALVTDGTLARKALCVRGATISTDSDDTESYISVPGFDGKIYVSSAPTSHLRVTKGAKEFISWHNTVSDTPLVYRAISEHAVIHAFFVLAYSKVEIDKGVMVISERAHTSSNKVSSFFSTASPEARGYLNTIRKILKTAFSDPTNRPPIGHSQQKLAYVECLLDTAYSVMSDAAKDRISQLTLLLAQEIHSARKRLDASLPALFSKGSDIDPLKLADLRKGNLTISPLGMTLSTYGIVGKFVKDCREQIRNHHDLPKKSDAYGPGSAAGSASSIPVKIGNCIDALKAITGLDSFPSVHAYGVGDENWWAGEVNASSKDVTYYDIKSGTHVFLGEKQEERNIEELIEGVGKGKFIYDDTIILPSKYSDTNNTQVVETKKVKSLINAKYLGGFTKLYLGCVCDQNTPISAFPVALKLLMDAYNRVVLVNGGGLHTPEYFVVFSHPVSECPTDVWSPPVFVPAERQSGFSRMYSYTPSKPSSDPKTARVSYLATWITLKIYDVLRSNVDLSLQVRLGVRIPHPLQTWIEVICPRTYLGGGHDSYRSGAVTTDVQLATAVDLDLGFGEGVIPEAK